MMIGSKIISKILSVVTSCVLVGIVTSISLSQEAIQVDPGITSYQKASGVSGNLSSVGSDTILNLMTLWAEEFKKAYPNVNIQIEGKGSSTAPPALISGTAQLGPMSRAMKPTEIDEFEAKFGYKPTQIKTAIDTIGVYVHKDNPIQGLTMGQVDAIFSKTHRCGNPKEIRTWGDLALTGEWADKPISIYGRNSASGTYGFFKENALCKGDYKDEVKEQPGSAAVVQGVTEDRYGIGYSGIGYVTSGVRAVPLGFENKGFVEANMENAMNGSYPLARFLYVYINKAPDKPLEPLVKEFIKFIMSREGQEVVIKDGYFPLTADLVAKELANLE